MSIEAHNLVGSLLEAENSHFRVVFNLKGYGDKPGAYKELSEMELKGVQGISDTGQIFWQYFQVARDAMLIMDAEETADLNDLEKIEYNDPDAILANDMEIMRRVYNQDAGFYSDLQSGMYNRQVMQNITGLMKIGARTLDWDPKFKGIFHSMNYIEPGARYGEMYQNGKVNNMKDLAAWFVWAHTQPYYYSRSDDKKPDPGYEHYREQMGKLSALDIEKMLRIGFKQGFSDTYASEGEWLVHEEKLKIPVGSRLIISEEKPMSMDNFNRWKGETEEEREAHPLKWMGLKDGFKRYDGHRTKIKEYGLDKLYRIQIIDYWHMDKTARTAWYKARENK